MTNEFNKYQMQIKYYNSDSYKNIIIYKTNIFYIIFKKILKFYQNNKFYIGIGIIFTLIIKYFI
jgi:hypothetical protein